MAPVRSVLNMLLPRKEGVPLGQLQFKKTWRRG